MNTQKTILAAVAVSFGALGAYFGIKGYQLEKLRARVKTISQTGDDLVLEIKNLTGEQSESYRYAREIQAQMVDYLLNFKHGNAWKPNLNIAELEIMLIELRTLADVVRKVRAMKAA